MNDAAARLSRYFLRQFLISWAYGVFIAVGLWLIGVLSAHRVGHRCHAHALRTLRRPVHRRCTARGLAAVVEPGWTTFLLHDLLLSHRLCRRSWVRWWNPSFLGTARGISPYRGHHINRFLGVALLYFSVFCWPCRSSGRLVVLGGHVEGLNFFEVLLSQKPALTPQQSFFQCALTGDSAEATYHAELALKDRAARDHPL